MSGTTRVSQYQKVHFTICGIFWCKMKITQADAPTIRMDCHPSRLIGAPTSTISTIFMPDALPDTTLPIYRGHGTGTKYAGLHTRWLGCIPGGSNNKHNSVQHIPKVVHYCPWRWPMIYNRDKTSANLDVWAVHSETVLMPTQTFAAVKHHSRHVFTIVALKHTTSAEMWS